LTHANRRSTNNDKQPLVDEIIYTELGHVLDEKIDYKIYTEKSGNYNNSIKINNKLPHFCGTLFVMSGNKEDKGKRVV
jgi:hypothetical protein